MKNEALLTQYEASFGHEAKRAGENSFFMMRSIASCAQHASCAARRALLKKARCEASGFFLASLVEMNLRNTIEGRTERKSLCNGMYY
jgi:hypothetical protein